VVKNINGIALIEKYFSQVPCLCEYLLSKTSIEIFLNNNNLYDEIQSSRIELQKVVDAK
jgi:hypothetical protein